MPQDMELSEFVSKTIIDIAKGLETAAEVLSDSDIIINPATQDGLAVSLRYTAMIRKDIDLHNRLILMSLLWRQIKM